MSEDTGRPVRDERWDELVGRWPSVSAEHWRGSARCVYPSCDCDGPEGPACGLPGYAEMMNRDSLTPYCVYPSCDCEHLCGDSATAPRHLRSIEVREFTDE